MKGKEGGQADMKDELTETKVSRATLAGIFLLRVSLPAARPATTMVYSCTSVRRPPDKSVLRSSRLSRCERLGANAASPWNSPSLSGRMFVHSWWGESAPKAKSPRLVDLTFSAN